MAMPPKVVVEKRCQFSGPTWTQVIDGISVPVPVSAVPALNLLQDKGDSLEIEVKLNIPKGPRWDLGGTKQWATGSTEKDCIMSFGTENAKVIVSAVTNTNNPDYMIT